MSEQLPIIKLIKPQENGAQAASGNSAGQVQQEENLFAHIMNDIDQKDAQGLCDGTITYDEYSAVKESLEQDEQKFFDNYYALTNGAGFDYYVDTDNDGVADNIELDVETGNVTYLGSSDVQQTTDTAEQPVDESKDADEAEEAVEDNSPKVSDNTDIKCDPKAVPWSQAESVYNQMTEAERNQFLDTYLYGDNRALQDPRAIINAMTGYIIDNPGAVKADGSVELPTYLQLQEQVGKIYHVEASTTPTVEVDVSEDVEVTGSETEVTEAPVDEEVTEAPVEEKPEEAVEGDITAEGKLKDDEQEALTRLNGANFDKLDRMNDEEKEQYANDMKTLLDSDAQLDFSEKDIPDSIVKMAVDLYSDATYEEKLDATVKLIESGIPLNQNSMGADNELVFDALEEVASDPDSFDELSDGVKQNYTETLFNYASVSDLNAMDLSGLTLDLDIHSPLYTKIKGSDPVTLINLLNSGVNIPSISGNDEVVSKILMQDPLNPNSLTDVNLDSDVVEKYIDKMDGQDKKAFIDKLVDSGLSLEDVELPDDYVTDILNNFNDEATTDKAALANKIGRLMRSNVEIPKDYVNEEFAVALISEAGPGGLKGITLQDNIAELVAEYYDDDMTSKDELDAFVATGVVIPTDISVEKLVDLPIAPEQFSAEFINDTIGEMTHGDEISDDYLEPNAMKMIANMLSSPDAENLDDYGFVKDFVTQLSQNPTQYPGINLSAANVPVEVFTDIIDDLKENKQEKFLGWLNSLQYPDAAKLNEIYDYEPVKPETITDQEG